MKTVAAVILCVLFAAAGGLAWPSGVCAAEAAVIDRIVAVVNEDIITQYDIELAMRPMAESIKAKRLSLEIERQHFAQLRQDVVNSMIDSKLTEQEVKRFNINIGEEEIESYIRQVKQRRSMTDENLKAGLASQGFSLEEYRKEVKAQLQRTKLVNREVKSKVVITQEEINAYFEKNRAKYGGGKQYHLWNLLVKTPPGAGEVEKQKAQGLLQGATEELKRGRPFEEIARQAADGAGGIQGADLGLFRVEDLTPQLREVAKKMKAGEHSPVVATDFGYQVIFVQEILDSPARPLAEVESEIQDLLYRDVVEDKFQSWLTALRKRSHVKIIEAQ
jgi:peptidyl-prolyl cis-trans isomerase SurA